MLQDRKEKQIFSAVFSNGNTGRLRKGEKECFEIFFVFCLIFSCESDKLAQLLNFYV